MEKLLAWLPERPQPPIVRYGTTAIIVAICFAVLLLVQLQSGVDSFFLMYPAVFLGALLFDRGSGFSAKPCAKDGSARSKPNAPRTCFTESCGIAPRTISPR